MPLAEARSMRGAPGERSRENFRPDSELAAPASLDIGDLSRLCHNDQPLNGISR
jgi:hypothetical protein